jgi:hypothetical protein
VKQLVSNNHEQASGSEENSMRENQVRNAGVFPYLINQASFFDKVVINVSGIRRSRPQRWTRRERNLPIGGPGRFYGRCIRGQLVVSGNDFQIKYGLLKRFRNLSPFVVTVWAGRAPVTCGGVLMLLDSLMRRGYKARIAAVELTFDVSGIPLLQFANDLSTRAQVREEFNEQDGTSTLYVGGTKSPWEVRIYQKFSPVRVEFVLRSTFLRSHNVVRPHELYLLRKARLWDRISFREFDQLKAHAFAERRRRDPLMPRWLGLLARMPMSIALRALRDAHVDPRHCVVRSQREVVLRKMHRNFIW